MVGSLEIIVKNRRLQYKFTIYRNITILRGDSATGKSTLIDMIEEYQRNGKSSGVEIECERPCISLTDVDSKHRIKSLHESIIFIDEGREFIASDEFADLIKKTDNYYVIAIRSSLFNIPYSIKEIYGIRNVSGNRYQGTKRLYTEIYRLYEDKFDAQFIPDVVYVEDAKAGYTFLKIISRDLELSVKAPKAIVMCMMN